MKRVFLSVLLGFFMIFSSFSQKISSEAERLIGDFFDLRVSLSYFDEKDVGSILDAVEKFSSDHADDIASLDEQGKIIMENFIEMEKYNYLLDDPSEKKNLERKMNSLREQCEKFVGSKAPSEIDKWLYVTYGDVTSCYIGFSAAAVLKYGKSVKAFYEKAIAIDENFSYALTNIAQWYFWAPAIGGGSKKTAGKYFERAKKAASTSAERYYASIFLSQYDFDYGSRADAASLLNEAVELYPRSNYLKKIASLNEKGISIWSYNKSKSSLKDEEKKTK